MADTVATVDNMLRRLTVNDVYRSLHMLAQQSDIGTIDFIEPLTSVGQILNVLPSLTDAVDPRISCLRETKDAVETWLARWKMICEENGFLTFGEGVQFACQSLFLLSRFFQGVGITTL